MARSFGETLREMREAQEMGLRVAANCLGISPAYLSRIERGRERPPKPEIVKRMATLLGGDPDLLFRLAESTESRSGRIPALDAGPSRIPASGTGDVFDLGRLQGLDRGDQPTPAVGGGRDSGNTGEWQVVLRAVQGLIKS